MLIGKAIFSRPSHKVNPAYTPALIVVFRKILAHTSLNIIDSVICVFLGQKYLKAQSLKLFERRGIRLGCVVMGPAQSWSNALPNQLKIRPSSRSRDPRFAFAHVYTWAETSYKQQLTHNDRIVVNTRLQLPLLFQFVELLVLRKWSRSQQSHVLHYLNKWFKVLFHLLLWLLSSSLLLCVPSPASAAEHILLHMSSLSNGLSLQCMTVAIVIECHSLACVQEKRLRSSEVAHQRLSGSWHRLFKAYTFKASTNFR